jgi:hypothetical protein
MIITYIGLPLQVVPAGVKWITAFENWRNKLVAMSHKHIDYMPG